MKITSEMLADFKAQTGNTLTLKTAQSFTDFIAVQLVEEQTKRHAFLDSAGNLWGYLEDLLIQANNGGGTPEDIVLVANAINAIGAVIGKEVPNE